MNLIGTRTLFMKEVRRFLKVPGQTLAQPVIMTSLYFLVFGFSLGGRVAAFEGVPYVRFIVPGLVMLALIQNALMNSSSSMFVMKIQGTIVDLLVAPLSVGELLSAFIGAAMLRGLLVGALVWAVSGLWTGLALAHPLWTLAMAVLVALVFALMGMTLAIWSNKFEQLNFVPAFVITPLTFLGGVFYSVRTLPEPWQTVARLNPVLYMVEGLRYGMLGVSAIPAWVGLVFTASLASVLLGVAWWMLATGYKLRG